MREDKSKEQGRAVWKSEHQSDTLTSDMHASLAEGDTVIWCIYSRQCHVTRNKVACKYLPSYTYSVPLLLRTYDNLGMSGMHDTAS